MTKRISMAAALLLLAGAAGAQEAAPQPVPPAAPAKPGGYHAHDGFYLQMDLGFGGQNSKASQGGLSLELSGAGAQFGIGLGGAVTPSFLIGGRLFATSVSDPTVKLNTPESNWLPLFSAALAEYNQPA
jgi:opacity protein-like surface antigen